jgi:hypothetical protein
MGSFISYTLLQIVTHIYIYSFFLFTHAGLRHTCLTCQQLQLKISMTSSQNSSPCSTSSSTGPSPPLKAPPVKLQSPPPKACYHRALAFGPPVAEEGPTLPFRLEQVPDEPRRRSKINQGAERQVKAKVTTPTDDTNDRYSLSHQHICCNLPPFACCPIEGCMSTAFRIIPPQPTFAEGQVFCCTCNARMSLSVMLASGQLHHDGTHIPTDMLGSSDDSDPASDDSENRVRLDGSVARGWQG